VAIFFATFTQALHESRQRQFKRESRRRQYLIEQTRAYENRCTRKTSALRSCGARTSDGLWTVRTPLASLTPPNSVEADAILRFSCRVIYFPAAPNARIF